MFAQFTPASLKGSLLGNNLHDRPYCQRATDTISRHDLPLSRSVTPAVYLRHFGFKTEQAAEASLLILISPT
jgi:hypothetical protein